MTQHEIVALQCPSCGGGIIGPSRDKPFGAEFRCDRCGVTSVLIIDRALVPLGTLQKEGEKVCLTCGRIAAREARFCQEGHPLTRKCPFRNCSRDFAVDHQRCDFCGMLYPIAPLQLGEVYQGFVPFKEIRDDDGVYRGTRVVVDVGVAVGEMDPEEFRKESGYHFTVGGADKSISVKAYEKEIYGGLKQIWFRRY